MFYERALATVREVFRTRTFLTKCFIVDKHALDYLPQIQPPPLAMAMAKNSALYSGALFMKWTIADSDASAKSTKT